MMVQEVRSPWTLARIKGYLDMTKKLCYKKAPMVP